MFAELAREHHKDENARKRDGDLNYFTQDKAESHIGKIPQNVVDTVFQLKMLGDIAPDVVESPEGFHVIQLTGKIESNTHDIERATFSIRRKLWRARRDEERSEFIRTLRESTKIEVDWDALRKLDI